MLTREMFSTLEEKFRVSARPCDILYLFLEYIIKDLTWGDLELSRSNSGLISWNSRNKPKRHKLARPILSQN